MYLRILLQVFRTPVPHMPLVRPIVPVFRLPRPFIKYTPTWPRSFMPTHQSQREQIAHMKLIPVRELIKDKSMVLIDDSIVRGTQLGQTTQFLYESGAKEVHIRPACPPLLYGCKYLNFSRSKSEMDLITRRVTRSGKEQ